jgi:FlaA1/EpsC-like NDP-sugar epimerase
MIYRFYNRTTQVMIDAAIFATALFLAYLIRFEGIPPRSYFKQFWFLLPYIVIGSALVYFLAGIYHFIWRYVSIREMMSIATCQGVIFGAMIAGRFGIGSHYETAEIPLSVIILYTCLAYLGTAGIRMLRRILYEKYGFLKGKSDGNTKKVLLIGAGSAGVLAAKELAHRRDLGLRVQGFIDDDRDKAGRVIYGIKVIGTTEQLPSLVERHKIDEVIITIATARRKDMRRIVEICEQIPVPVKIMPGLYEILSGRVSVSTFREVRIEDLLGREVVEFDNHTPEVLSRFAGRRILITGAGGSIGAELCRQLLALNPSELLMLEKDESGLFEIDMELRRRAATTKLTPIIADVRNLERLRRVFERHRPEVIFHAAAHKHVPLMELNPSEAILNNVVSTKHLVELAHQYQVETFVMISTDKAVNPANVMGASKRLAEMIVQAKAGASQTRYSCVRFGNVLGSRGSVVPLFQKQIAEGGPVTVTHLEMTRYFMTIPEAAHLVIQAGSLGERGEIFVLDMGEPVKILDLAKDMIRLSGLKLGEDIEIELIGLRPGEKLYEELLISDEGTKTTQYKKIFIAPPTEVNAGKLEMMLTRLEAAAAQDDQSAIGEILEDWFNECENAASAPGRRISFSVSQGR